MVFEALEIVAAFFCIPAVFLNHCILNPSVGGWLVTAIFTFGIWVAPGIGLAKCVRWEYRALRGTFPR